jgi:uncharacterized cupredoxin-like copper-binding protein
MEVIMAPRVHRVPLAVLAGLVLASCRSDKPPAAEAGAPAAAAPAGSAAPSTVTVIATDYSFDAPGELPAGLTTFRLVNRGPSIHHIQLVKFGEGKTFDDFMAALKAGGPPPKWATMEGGPNPSELGDTSSTMVTLEPGNYAMLCFVPGPDGVPHVAKGMVRPLTVTGGGAAAAEPEADVVMKLVDYDFELSKPLTAGRHTIRIENAGPQEHEVAIVKLGAGKEPMDFAKWGEKQVGKAPGTLHGGVSGIMPGGKAFVEVDLAPGEYGLICFVPDSKDGKGHYHHGMAKKVTVS